jgi:hypothetical protein
MPGDSGTGTGLQTVMAQVGNLIQIFARHAPRRRSLRG